MASNDIDLSSTKDSVIDIPENKRLNHLSKYEVKDFENNSENPPKIISLNAQPLLVAVEFPMKLLYLKDLLKKFIAPWIEQRGEWIGIIYRKWREFSPIYVRESYYGPYELNEYCSEKLLQAYSLGPSDLNLEQVRTTSPKQLEAILNSRKTEVYRDSP